MLRRSFWKQAVLVVPAVALALTGWATVSVAQDKKEEKKPAAQPPTAQPAPAAKGKTIVDVASGDKQFSTLVELLTIAGLVDTLKGDGPFTVFAPNNAAFEKMGKDKLDALKKDKAKLTNVLKNHVVKGKAMAKDVTKSKTHKTLFEGGEITVTEKDGKVMIDKATIVKADVDASNGVIHVIDDVLMIKDAK